MAQWSSFAVVAVVLTLAMLLLARATADVLALDQGSEMLEEAGEVAGDDREGTIVDDREEFASGRPPTDSTTEPPEDTLPSSLSGPSLLANAALSHSLLGAILVGAAWFAGIPASAFGVAADGRLLAIGAGIGVVLYVANETGAWLARRVGLGADEQLRELLAPDTAIEWMLLLLVLPTIALVEELLFRGALIGVLAAGYGISPWWLAVASSVAFGLGHGLQGPGGVVVTGLLGFALAAAYVVTGSLLVVVVAHYLVNALEFVVHEGLDRST